MTIEKLNIFVTVAETLSFTQAAERLHFSQPTLSRHISNLEEELGFELFLRTTRKVELTEMGRYFLNEARHLLREYSQLLSQIANLGERHFGSLTIGTPEFMTQTFLSEAIERFSQQHPAVNIDVRIIEPGNCNNLLRNRVIDLGFFVSTDADVNSPELETELLSTGKLGLVCKRTHPLAGRQVVRTTDLDGERLYVINRNSTPFLWNEINQFFLKKQIDRCIQEEVSSPSAQIMLVQAGLGLAMMADNLLQEQIRPDLLRIVHLEGFDVASHLVMAWRHQSDNFFVDIIREIISEVREENRMRHKQPIEWE